MRLEVVGLHQVAFRVSRYSDSNLICEVVFPQDRFGEGRPQSFKRVNSIDQFRLINENGVLTRRGNENQTVLPTLTTARDAEWISFFLLRNAGEEMPFVGSAFTEVRGRDTNPNYEEIFLVSDTSPSGGERISIIPLS